MPVLRALLHRRAHLSQLCEPVRGALSAGVSRTTLPPSTHRHDLATESAVYYLGQTSEGGVYKRCNLPSAMKLEWMALGRNLPRSSHPTMDCSWPSPPVGPCATKLPLKVAAPDRIDRATTFDNQISVCSETSSASSTSMPRYLTVDSSLECPSNSCTARKFFVRR